MKNNYDDILEVIADNNWLIYYLNQNSKQSKVLGRELVKINPLFYDELGQKVQKDNQVIQNILDGVSEDFEAFSIPFKSMYRNSSSEEQKNRISRLMQIEAYKNLLRTVKGADWKPSNYMQLHSSNEESKEILNSEKVLKYIK